MCIVTSRVTKPGFRENKLLCFELHLIMYVCLCKYLSKYVPLQFTKYTEIVLDSLPIIITYRFFLNWKLDHTNIVCKLSVDVGLVYASKKALILSSK